MGCSRKELSFCSLLLLLVLLLLLRASSSDGSARFGSVKTASPSSPSASDLSPLSTSNGSSSSSAVFGDVKRKVYTGPNPLHNRRRR
ncbi:hypothetical protein CRG98_002427 [Punica granatum]|uniref:Uncharacterized protein n=1 Tax=Punica granatum TaxID=22663 RepID=A0A2I0L937_PUNGR|nr:hypothetical protein CRG98_002427 [Punica granatum]